MPYDLSLSASPPVSGSGLVSISTTSFPTNGSGEIPVGAGVHFDTSSISGFDTTDSPGSDYNAGRVDLVARWDLDDSGTWDKPGLMFDEHKQRGLSLGHSVTHAWETAGTKTVSVEVRDSNGESGTSNTSVTVVSLEDYVPQANRIVVDPAGTYTGAPTHDAANEYTTINTAITAARAITGIVGIWFKTDETYTWTSGTRFENDWSSSDALIMAAYGGGARPIIEWPGSANGWWLDSTSTLTGILCHGLDFKGNWNPADVGLDSGSSLDQGIFYPQYTGHVNLFDCEVRGFDVGIYLPGSTDGGGSITSVVDCEFTDWRDFCLFGEIVNAGPTGRLGVSGCYLGQNQQAAAGINPRGGQRDTRAENNAHTMRVGDEYVTIRSSYIYGANGWSGLSPHSPSNQDEQHTAVQPLRVNTGGIPGCKCDIWGCVMEGGSTAFYSISATFGASDVNMTGVIDGTVVVQNGSTGTEVFQFGNTGWAIRNTLTIAPNIPSYIQLSTLPRTFIGATSGATAPLHSYNNTVIDLRNSTNQYGAFSPTGTVPSGSVSVNNVYYAPNAPTPDTADAPLNTTATGFSAKTLGYKQGFRPVYVSIGSVAPGSSVTAPYPTGFTQSDFTGGNAPDWCETISTSAFLNLTERSGECSWTYNASSANIQNDTGASWPSGEFMAMFNVAKVDTVDTTYAVPSSAMATYEPTTGSAAIGDASKTVSDKWALTDIKGDWRASTLAGLSRSVESRGALEPNLES